MDNIFKYTDKAAYTAATDRPTNAPSVSFLENPSEVAYDGINTIVPFVESNVEYGDFIIFDKVDNDHKILKGKTLRLALLDSRYVFSNAAFAFKFGKKLFFMDAQQYSWQWAANTEYKLTLDLLHNGGFEWSCKPRGEQFSGSVSWLAGASIDSVMSQLSNQTGLTFTKLDASNIVVSLSNYTSAVLTISNDNGVTVTDCSLTGRIGEDGTVAGVHHSWQGEAVKTCFPSIDWPGASSTCYAKNGVNTGGYTGVNLARFVTYWSTNGEASYVAESNQKPMKRAAFDALIESGVEAQVALYNKYEGSYEKYCAARMYDFDCIKGTNQSYRDRALELNNNLAECVFTAADGSTKHCYIAAYETSRKGIETEGYVTGFEPGNWTMLPQAGAASIFNDDIMPQINAGIANCNQKTLLTNNQSIWCLGEYNASYGWFVYGTNGCLLNNAKMLSTAVRLAIAFEPKN